MSTVNQDGSEVRIESVFFRYHVEYYSRHESIEDAQLFLDHGADYGELAAAGILVDGKCVRFSEIGEWSAQPTSEEAAEVEKIRHLAIEWP